jgi:hypothetical protein
MHGLGRLYPMLMNDMLRDDDRRRADAWRRLHQMPDAEPLPDVSPAPDPAWRARGLAFHGLRHRLFGARS